MIFLGSKTNVVEFVRDIVAHSNNDYQSIMIMPRARSEDCYVLIATDTSSEDTVETMAQNYLLERITTSWMSTLAG
jgi:hypothetical protein